MIFLCGSIQLLQVWLRPINAIVREETRVKGICELFLCGQRDVDRRCYGREKELGAATNQLIRYCTLVYVHLLECVLENQENQQYRFVSRLVKTLTMARRMALTFPHSAAMNPFSMAAHCFACVQIRSARCLRQIWSCKLPKHVVADRAGLVRSLARLEF